MLAQTIMRGIPTPAFSAALAFLDGYRSEFLPANLIQAQVRRLCCAATTISENFPFFRTASQRDYFGAQVPGSP